jgi:hypothetical protein
VNFHGCLSPVRNIWARLLQTAADNLNNVQNIDPFWTLTGYFNAIKELAGVRALYRQDIHQRLDHIGRENAVRSLITDVRSSLV